MNPKKIISCQREAEKHLNDELLPFWMNRCQDTSNGGFITHFDKDGNDTGDDEKSLIAQTRTVFTFSSAYRAGYHKERSLELAKHGIKYLLEVMWDKESGGFFWLTDRKGKIKIDEKIVYGQSFAIYALSEYTMATGDLVGIEYAEKVFDLLQIYAVDTMYGGYFEMFTRNWELKGPGPAGGDRKTLDVHMHLMEAYTSLYECSKKEIHRRKLLEMIQLVTSRILHPKYLTGIPQYNPEWKIAPQIKFDIIWGWDRFADSGMKPSAEDNTSYGHNVEFAWLLLHALDVLEHEISDFEQIIKLQFEHALKYGVDWDNGGIYVEGSHNGPASDKEKEFWQQAECLIGFLDACLLFGFDKYWPAYENVHRFVFDKMINHQTGEWWPLLSQEGTPIWTHMSHSWKVNYHSVRSMIQTIDRLKICAEAFR